MTNRRSSALAANAAAIAAAFAAPPADARLVRLEITARQTVAGGAAFGASGAYEKLTGTAYFEVDPKDSRNARVFDLDRAPTNAAGRVAFSADAVILKPLDMSPAEVSSFVAAGKLKTLAIMSDQRLTGLYAGVPTFKERGIDLAVGTWRGLGVPLGTPPDVVAYLRDVTRKVADDPGYKDAMAKSNLLTWYQEGEQFKSFMAAQSVNFKRLLEKLPVQK